MMIARKFTTKALARSLAKQPNTLAWGFSFRGVSLIVERPHSPIPARLQEREAVDIDDVIS